MKFINKLNRLFKRKGTMNPPDNIVNINSGDSLIIGNAFLKHFVELGGLKRNDDVLDVGSGYGRMAIPLTDYLESNSRYEGIEIIPRAVDWCVNNITPKYANFNFTRINVKNGRYNPSGTINAHEYKFPFEDESFDFVFLTSVFTHMLPKDLENYMAEISRVLRKGGISFITYFILNNDSTPLIDSGNSTYHLKFTYEGCRIEKLEDPEYAIAYEEDYISSLNSKFNLKIQSTFYGNWCGRDKSTDFQDIVVAEKL
ncbi:class I SAM-dependent methyltransferase [Ekhidna sp.]|uniref:class I SAM-dependent methyltransferase n=1 Tax=Ekhidna sp. TaxID=2608089 RepID=UPI003CCB8EC9